MVPGIISRRPGILSLGVGRVSGGQRDVVQVADRVGGIAITRIIVNGGRGSRIDQCNPVHGFRFFGPRAGKKFLSAN